LKEEGKGGMREWEWSSEWQCDMTRNENRNMKYWLCLIGIYIGGDMWEWHIWDVRNEEMCIGGIMGLFHTTTQGLISKDFWKRK
jgi:hypothetical protein